MPPDSNAQSLENLASKRNPAGDLYLRLDNCSRTPKAPLAASIYLEAHGNPDIGSAGLHLQQTTDDASASMKNCGDIDQVAVLAVPDQLDTLPRYAIGIETWQCSGSHKPSIGKFYDAATASRRSSSDIDE